MEYIIPAVVVILLLFFVARELMCWYWKINDIIKNQEEQLDQMDILLGKMNVQNKLLFRIVEQIEPEEEPEEIEHEESTP